MARVCVIRQGYFPLDTRVRREVAALADEGHDVDVICVRRAGEQRRERLGRVCVHRLDLTLRRGGPLAYAWQYGAFLVAAGAFAAGLGLRRRWDVVQVNSMPDALVFAAAGPRLLGARVILDLHECMPEFVATKYGLAPGHPVVRLVARLEQASIRFADETLTCTEQMRAAFVRRGAPAHRITVVLNAADEAVFDVRRFPPAPRRAGRLTLLCHGSMEERYGLDTLIRAVALLADDLPGLRVELYGEGRERDELQRLAARLGVAGRVRFSDGFVPIHELLRAIADADVGVVAMKRDAFRDLTHCNKMFDFIAMRRPAICSRTTSVEAYFPDDCFAMFTAGDERDLARAVRELYDDPARGERLVARAEEVSEPYRWVHQRRIYARVVSGLATRRRRVHDAKPDGRRERVTAGADPA